MGESRIRRFCIGLVAVACIAGLAAAAAISVPPELTLGAACLATRFLAPPSGRHLSLAIFVLQLALAAVAASLHLTVHGAPVAAAWLAGLLVVAIYRALRPPPRALVASSPSGLATLKALQSALNYPGRESNPRPVWIGVDLGAAPDRTAVTTLERRPGRPDRVTTFTLEPRAPSPA